MSRRTFVLLMAVVLVTIVGQCGSNAKLSSVKAGSRFDTSAERSAPGGTKAKARARRAMGMGMGMGMGLGKSGMAGPSPKSKPGPKPKPYPDDGSLGRLGLLGPKSKPCPKERPGMGPAADADCEEDGQDRLPATTTTAPTSSPSAVPTLGNGGPAGQPSGLPPILAALGEACNNDTVFCGTALTCVFDLQVNVFVGVCASSFASSFAALGEACNTATVFCGTTLTCVFDLQVSDSEGVCATPPSLTLAPSAAPATSATTPAPATSLPTAAPATSEPTATPSAAPASSSPTDTPTEPGDSRTPSSPPTQGPTLYPTFSPSEHACNSGIHSCDTTEFGICEQVNNSKDYQCSCASSHHCSDSGCHTCVLTTDAPSASPSTPLTAAPATSGPTAAPTAAPTATPASVGPTAGPTAAPTASPASTGPTTTPSAVPTATPASVGPTAVPTAGPTAAPSAAPASSGPTAQPTAQPTVTPASSTPTAGPTAAPMSSSPTGSPSAQPTRAPTAPTAAPSRLPTMFPTGNPTPSGGGGTCLDSCGGQGAGGECYCDNLCRQPSNSDCCEDIDLHCGTLPPTQAVNQNTANTANTMVSTEGTGSPDTTPTWTAATCDVVFMTAVSETATCSSAAESTVRSHTLSTSAGFTAQDCSVFTVSDDGVDTVFYMTIMPVCKVTPSDPDKWTVCSWQPNPTSILCSALNLQCCDHVTDYISPPLDWSSDLSCQEYVASDDAGVDGTNCNHVYGYSGGIPQKYTLDFRACEGTIPPISNCGGLAADESVSEPVAAAGTVSLELLGAGFVVLAVALAIRRRNHQASPMAAKTASHYEHYGSSSSEVGAWTKAEPERESLTRVRDDSLAEDEGYPETPGPSPFSPLFCLIRDGKSPLPGTVEDEGGENVPLLRH